MFKAQGFIDFLKVLSAKDNYDLIEESNYFEHLELDNDEFGKVSPKMVHVVFWGLQNLNENLHFAFQTINNFFFLFMQSYLRNFSMTKMVSSYGVCVCGLSGVWLGWETCVALSKVL